MDILELKIKNLREQKEEIIKNKKTMLSIKKEMSDLTTNQNVAIYAHALEEMIECHRVKPYLDVATKFKDDEIVQKYIRLRRKLNKLENEIIEYNIKIQKELKRSINKKMNTATYIYYGRDENNNIVTRCATSEELSLLKNNKEAVLPTKELKSKRKIRHFYNRVSFKYLEELTQDNSFSLEGKDLGRVKKLVKKN
ncbi:MAG: hypothetical protein IJI43_02410 [Bacilli bacterium]|nr:hypothetical protein [Bacilli bacterium]